MNNSVRADRRFLSRIQFPVTICVLLYGEHFELCRRFLHSLYTKTPVDAFRLRAGLNAVCDATRALVSETAEEYGNLTLIDSPQNIYKCPMMRRLFTEPPIETEWTLWFDDDSFPARADWLQSLALSIEASPENAMWGLPMLMEPDPPLIEFTKVAPWFRGKELTRNSRTNAINYQFIVGGYWAIKTEVIRHLDWPDRRLLHFEDDYLLGEALRQNDFRMGHCESGVVIDSAVRRCPPGTPHVR